MVAAGDPVCAIPGGDAVNPDARFREDEERRKWRATGLLAGLAMTVVHRQGWLRAFVANGAAGALADIPAAHEHLRERKNSYAIENSGTMFSA
jgi:hypothetical protein